jgi:hypothetical protein
LHMDLPGEADKVSGEQNRRQRRQAPSYPSHATV